MKNYYEILGISRSATQAQIKAAYRMLAKKYHPDSSPESEEVKELFQEIQEAYAVLSDPEKRKTYHYYGHEAYRKSYHAQHTGHTDTDGHCGACSHQKKPEPEEGPPPQAVRIAVWLDLEETLRTVEKDACYTEHFSSSGGLSSSRQPDKNWKFRVKLPPGSYDHQFFLLEDVIIGEKDFLKAQNKRNPDKIFVIIVLLRDKPGFLRQGYHLYTDCLVDYHTLVLGGKAKIPALEGEILFDIPPGTVPEQKLRIVNHGLVRPKKMGGRGDLYVKLHIRIPQSLTPAQQDALEKLRDVMEAF